MCGIAGIINTNGFDPSQLERMTNIVRHRGPDDEGYVIFTDRDDEPRCAGGKDTPPESFSSGFRYQPVEHINSFPSTKCVIGLGHRRLSILDLSSSGHQPLCSADGKQWITFNGEIYNYLEIRDELRKFGYQFNTSTDTEVLLYAYKQWGPDCLQKFLGMWSFAIYDIDKNEIFLARDRYGIKPLYYWFSPYGDFCFGSEIKQFTVINGWQAKLNGQRAYDYLFYSLTDHTEETMFQGVYHIPGGHYIKLQIEDIFTDKKQKLKPIRWYEVKYEKYKGSLHTAALTFEDLFKKAVQIHLRADVPIGTALSGGLDSSAIVCAINNLLTEQDKADIQQTFSSCSTDERYNERKWMDLVVEQTKVNTNFVYPEFDNFLKLTSDIIWHQDEPYQSQSVYLGYHVFELAHNKNVKVLLNGQGADEYLGGYGQFRIIYYANLIKNGNWRAFIKEIKTNRVQVSNQKLPIIFQTLHYFLPERIKNILQIKLGNMKHFRACIDMEKLNAKEEHPNNQIPVKYNSAAQIAQHMTFHSTLPRFLRWEDRNSMAHSVEARVPFLDHRLVEFTSNLPVGFLDNGMETKKVMRVALKNLLPSKITDRKDKKGFITPEERWVKEDHTAAFRSMLENSISDLQGIIKPYALSYFDKIASGKLPFDYTYWRMILLAIWVKRFDVQITN